MPVMAEHDLVRMVGWIPSRVGGSGPVARENGRGIEAVNRGVDHEKAVDVPEL